MKQPRGLTLIEVIIYITLLSLLMTGTLSAVYTLISGTDRTGNHIEVEEEGNFVLNKLTWALSDLSPTTAAFVGTSSSITVSRYDASSVSFRLNGKRIEIREGAQPYLPITTANVKVEDLAFHYITTTGSGPIGIEVTFVIEGVAFSIKKYAH